MHCIVPHGRRRAARRQQRGQALIYGMFVVIGALAALFFLFNTGQLSQEKTKLVNTADAVAYSAGVMHARALNFSAYGNRALVANEVLVAQMVSLSSWAQYAETRVQNLPSQFPHCLDSSGYSSAAGAFLYGAKYAIMCYAVVQYLGEYIEDVAKEVPDLTEKVVKAVELNKKAIQQAHNLLHAPLYLQSLRADVMQDVARANYANDGSVQVEPLGPGMASALTDDWGSFTRKYSGQDRKRMAELARYAAHTDEFTHKRNWDSYAAFPTCLLPLGRSRVSRGGGTDLVNYDEWIAQDTESLWQAYPRFLRCKYWESPIAYGEQQAHPKGQDQDDSGASLGGARDNPEASSMASSSHWTGYSGIPSYYDLSQQQLDKSDPALRFSVRLVRARSELRTSDGKSEIRASSDSRINAYKSQVASNVMAAVATSEVYFERPFDQRENLYGKTLGRPRELPSLFNPYWRVRLVHSETDVQAQQLLQGAHIP
ncbi:hypothetical protein D8B23_13930 [Verminephrobacter aporrectodeae subsp. tuberculatae]|uniref:pilus assembly protein TadG-related protein n=1 Tax=Verminephrobacter aporrectodeae TaxID=1110389 RepID=UPI002236F506|nr:pilus assembly protein TadG-related protein [Verminephrobacter aporrectodeae]MCW5220941.1 hypothetical protein [Verminephrobacter aporrectodeae subsp. tuberculatae]MCW5290235.1 hypothetical protein [Verminephrobacter aporrectodeae subsp. tuberculatae]MCW8199490.1 hypothetical protein [Verminephrobacter aporrectodeae subsp. tuberculatae]